MDCSGFTCIINTGGSKNFYYKGRPVSRKNVPPQYIEEIIARAINKYDPQAAKMRGAKRRAFRSPPKTADPVLAMLEELNRLEEEKRRLEERICFLNQEINTLDLEQLSGRTLLLALGLRNRKDWKVWLRENHPDKNCNFDPQLVARVNSEAQIYFPRS